MRTDNELVSARNFKIGFIYGGAPVGEFQLDKNDGKTIWWKRADGCIQKVNPHPDAIFYVIAQVGTHNDT